MTPVAPIEDLRRPGCPFCTRLRRGLRRAGIETVERDVWADPHAAARLRQVTGGDETVPTVIIGDLGLVNPSVKQVIAATGAASRPTDDRPAAGTRPDRERSTARRKNLLRGVSATAAVALAWFVLAVWRPTTTWHLAPVLTAGMLPWFATQDLSSVRRKTWTALIAAISGGAAASLAALTLSGMGLLRGPTLGASHDALAEALLFIGGTVVAAVLVGLWRGTRPETAGSAQGPTTQVPGESDAAPS